MASNINRDDDSDPKERFDNVCRDLNMDGETSEEAWNSFERIRTNYSLEVCVDEHCTWLLQIHEVVASSLGTQRFL